MGKFKNEQITQEEKVDVMQDLIGITVQDLVDIKSQLSSHRSCLRGKMESLFENERYWASQIREYGANSTACASGETCEEMLSTVQKFTADKNRDLKKTDELIDTITNKLRSN